MFQSTLDLDMQAADHSDRIGFQLGWDHAHHGLAPSFDALDQRSSLRQGWSAARAVFGHRTLAAPRHVRDWLRLRLQAWHESTPYDGLQLTPHYLAQLRASVCPITRRALGGADGDAATLCRLQRAGGYATGVLATLSRDAAAALASLDAQSPIDDAISRAKRSAGRTSDDATLSEAAWRRLSVLVSFVTPLQHAEAAAMPLLVLPPNRVRVINACQSLQVLLTWQLAGSGWSGRLRQVASMIDDRATRHEFLLFVGALAPRVMALPEGASHAALRQSLESIWEDERVQRRWKLFALTLGEDGADALANRASAVRLQGRHALVHARDADSNAASSNRSPQAVARSRPRRAAAAAD